MADEGNGLTLPYDGYDLKLSGFVQYMSSIIGYAEYRPKFYNIFVIVLFLPTLRHSKTVLQSDTEAIMVGALIGSSIVLFVLIMIYVVYKYGVGRFQFRKTVSSTIRRYNPFSRLKKDRRYSSSIASSPSRVSDFVNTGIKYTKRMLLLPFELGRHLPFSRPQRSNEKVSAFTGSLSSRIYRPIKRTLEYTRYLLFLPFTVSRYLPFSGLRGSGRTDIFEAVETSVETGDDLREKAHSRRDAGAYDRAIEAIENAREAYERALDTAAGTTLINTETIEEKLADLDDEQRDTRKQRLQDEVESLRSSLDNAEALADEGDLDSAQTALGDIESDVASVKETATQHDFESLHEKLRSLEQRRQDRLEAIDRRLEAGPPDMVPRAPDLSVTYDALTDREPIGAGGNADVTRATLPTPDGDATLAIKEPRMSGTLHTETVERMMNEAETWDKLDDHDHIVGVVDYGSEPMPWIAMEYMDAGHLGERAGAMDVPQALWTALAVTRGVRHAHRRGVAHLDLKPANVLFRSVEGAWDVPKVADWGLSKHLLDHSKSVDGISSQYAAPEQFDDAYGSPDDITDIYQLGAVFYELFTGRPPFEGQPFRVIDKVKQEDPTPPSEVADVPAELDDILLRALAKEKSERYDDIVYLRDDIEDLFERVD